MRRVPRLGLRFSAEKEVRYDEKVCIWQDKVTSLMRARLYQFRDKSCAN